MLYNPPTGATDPNAGYIGKNVGAGIQGSRVPRMAIEGPQREIVAIIAEALLSPTNDDLKQTLKAIRSGLLDTFTAAGTANALTIAPLTPHLSSWKGLPFRIFPAFTNTGAATLQVNSLAPAPIVRRDGSALQAGDIVVGAPFDCVADGLGSFRMVSLAQGEVPRNVPSITLYVRTDGSDTNDGSANDSAHAFATIAAAVAKSISSFSLTGKTLTIQLGISGTYAMPGAIPATGGTLIIRGDPAAQGSYILSGAGPGGGGSSCIAAFSGSVVKLQGLTLSNTGTINNTLNAAAGGSVSVTNVTFNSVASSFGHLVASGGGTVSIDAGVVFNGSMAYALLAISGSINVASSTVVTVTGTPTFSQAFAAATSVGSIVVPSGSSFSGAANGPRYIASLNGVISVTGGGANFFPGNSAGSSSSGGQYA